MSLTPEGTGHVKLLHIVVECRGMIISRVLITNRSALNVCPPRILSRIDVEEPMIRPDRMMVRAFHGTKTLACGEIDLTILVGPCEFEVSFVIVNILTIFNLLLK